MRENTTRVARQAQCGIALLEVLIAGFVLAIGIVGFALMFSRSMNFVVGQGDTRVALYLAQQKIEKLRALGFSATPTGDQINDGCTNATQYYEPCYNETLQGGAGLETPAGTQVDRQTFTRLTCVRYVQDGDPEQLPDPLQPPGSWTCPNPPGCDPTDATTCPKTKRIKVAVIPLVLGGADPTAPIDENRVTVELVLTPTAKP